MLTVRMNDAAVAALGLLRGGQGALGPVDRLVPALRERVAGGVVRYGEVLAWAGAAVDPKAVSGELCDLTGWECASSSLHLEDFVPVRAGVTDDGQPVLGEQAQVSLLRQGLVLAGEVCGLAGEGAAPTAVVCIVAVNDTGATFRFHRPRAGESWIGRDLDGYRLEKIITVSSGVTAD
ncbi:hypothetical protein AB0D04_29210 [Streptomyces sp. NPDC048483]|uniref:hypothetical protein n=1 Tax=Streptomyces sp. NPDC048483 TaxID=3154927 RepID=UPI0034325E88